jgi:hypothetical protein
MNKGSRHSVKIPNISLGILLVFFLNLYWVNLSGQNQNADTAGIPASAQHQASKAFYWLDLGGGLGNLTTSNLSLNAELRHFTIGLTYRETRFGELKFFGPPIPTLQALNFKIGKLFKGKWWLIHTQVEAGMGQLQTPQNIESNFLSYNYTLNKQLAASWGLRTEAALNFQVASLGLQFGLSGTQRRAGFYVGVNLGFGKFF